MVSTGLSLESKTRLRRSLRILTGSTLKGILCALMACCPLLATTYYVAKSGNDSNAGTSSTSPWKTLARVNSASFSPGDFILFNRGDVWHEELIPSSSGTADNQITFSSYGLGANPVISGGDPVTQWAGSGLSANTSTTGCTGSCMFSSSMEAVNFSDWSQVYLPSADGTSLAQTASLAHSGSYSAQLKGGGPDNRGGLIESFPSLISEGILYFRFFLYVPAGALKANDQFIIFQVPEGSSNISLYTNGSGNISGLQFYSTGGSIVPWNTPIPFVMGAWNYVDVAFKVGASDGGGQVSVNGVNVGSRYSLNTMASLGVKSMTLGNDSYGHGPVAGGSIYLDDVEIATAGPIGAALPTTGGSLTSSNGIWSAPMAIQPKVVFIAGNLGVQRTSQSALSAPGQWSWSQGTLYVYSAAGAPGNVEAAQRNAAVMIGHSGPGNYVTISGIDLRISNGDVVDIVNTDGDVVTGGLITGGYQFGLLAIGASGGAVSNLIVSNNTVSINGSSGIEISSGHSFVTVNGNRVFGNAYNPVFSGVFIEMGGINFLGVPGVPDYDLVEYNISDHNGVFGGNESQGSGIWFDSIANSTMQYNVAFNNSAYGLYFEKTVNCLMFENDAYANGMAPNSANIAAYASQGAPSAGNVLENNMSWNSLNWGMKLGAYQGAGATKVYNNSYESNTVVGSQGVDLFADNGADNDGVNGYGNTYYGNAFGIPGVNWIYWVTYGFASSYAQVDAAYGTPMNNFQVGWTIPIGAQHACTGSCLFTSGMDSPAFADFSSVYQPASDGTKVSQTGHLSNSGTYALQINGGGQDNRGGLALATPALGNVSALYYRFYVNIPEGALQPNDQFQLFSLASGGPSVTLGTDANGSVISLGFGSSGVTILPTTAIDFKMGRWNYIDVAVKAGSGNGGGQVWVNGLSAGSNYGLNTAAFASSGGVTLGNTSYGHGQVAGGNIFVDDFRVATTGPIGAATVAVPVPAP